MAEWLRHETSEPGVTGSIQLKPLTVLSSHPAWSGRVPWSPFINMRDCLLFYNSPNSHRLVLLVITCEYKQINFTLPDPSQINKKCSRIYIGDLGILDIRDLQDLQEF